MATQIEHPTERSSSADRLRDEFALVECTRCPEPRWHFKVLVPKNAEAGPQGRDAPSLDEPLVSLGLFRYDSAEFEVFGHLLVREIDPIDFLEKWLETLGIAVSSIREIVTDGGVAGDVVGTWIAGGRDYAGRFYALKWGDRLYLLAFRVPAADYAAVAESFLVSMTTFTALDTGGSVLAEDVQPFGEATPVPWETIFTKSWLVQPDVIDERMTSFRASQLPLRKSPTELLFGKITFGLSVQKLASASGLSKAFIEALEDKCVVIPPCELREDHAAPPFVAAWSLSTPAVLNKPPFKDVPCEVRFRVVSIERCFLFAGCFGPSRETGAIAWMQNKRAMDLLMMHATVGQSAKRPS